VLHCLSNRELRWQCDSGSSNVNFLQAFKQKLSFEWCVQFGLFVLNSLRCHVITFPHLHISKWYSVGNFWHKQADFKTTDVQTLLKVKDDTYCDLKLFPFFWHSWCKLHYCDMSTGIGTCLKCNAVHFHSWIHNIYQLYTIWLLKTCVPVGSPCTEWPTL